MRTAITKAIAAAKAENSDLRFFKWMLSEGQPIIREDGTSEMNFYQATPFLEDGGSGEEMIGYLFTAVAQKLRQTVGVTEVNLK